MRLCALAFLLASLAALAQPPAVPASIAGKATLSLRRQIVTEPIQGFSSVRARPDGTFWMLADSGHGARARREDVQVAFHHVYIDWRAGTARLLSVEPLADPDRRLPFPIVQESTATRGLTTADVNVDGMAVVGDSAWVADDFGPWLIEADLHGRVRGVHAAQVGGRTLVGGEVRRGFGGLAASPDRRFLYAALEGPLWSGGGWESADGREYARILEFDLGERRWSGRALRYSLDANGNTIADLVVFAARAALVVERGRKFRRLYKVSFDGDQAKKIAYVDLGAVNMATVEGIELVELDYLVLTNGDRREFVLLRAPGLLTP